MGGMHGFGPVVVPGSDEAYHEPWEARTFAISTLVGIEGLGSGGGRAIREEMDPEHYLRASYYERWLWSTEQRLLRKGTIAPGEVDAWVERLSAGERMPQSSNPEQAARDRAAISRCDRSAKPTRRGLRAGDRVRVRRWRHAGTRAALATYAAPRARRRGTRHRRAARHRAVRRARSSPSMRCRSAPTTVFGASDEGSGQ